MCDTFVVLPNSTKDGSTIFGKNSDREPNEAQVIEFYPSARGVTRDVKCTYLEVMPSEETLAVLISRPFWMYGAEMGVNEYGVSIGNEPVFTRESRSTKGLLGTDILRLALERSKDAKTALRVITDLLGTYGQGGSGSIEREFLYHNSFLISDKESAWVLEAAGEFWAAKEIKDYYSISNILSIHTDYDLSSEGLEINARRAGRWGGSSQLDFAKAFQDRFYTWLGRGAERLKSTRRALGALAGRFTISDAKALLRVHSSNGGSPRHGSSSDVCMHAGGMLSPSQTASSMVNAFVDGVPVSFATGSSSACESVFKPHVIAGEKFIQYTTAGRSYSDESFWWILEKYHRSFDLSGMALPRMLALENELETVFLGLLKEKTSSPELIEFSKSCYAKEVDEIKKNLLSAQEVRASRYWRGLNRRAFVPV